MLRCGYLAFILDGKILPIYVVSFIMIVANIICEKVVTLFNTPDIIGELSGILRVVIALLYLNLMYKNGLIEIDNIKK